MAIAHTGDKFVQTANLNSLAVCDGVSVVLNIHAFYTWGYKDPTPNGCECEMNVRRFRDITFLVVVYSQNSVHYN